MSKRRAIQIGTGSRGVVYRDAMAFQFPETVELVGLCDVNPGRLALYQADLRARGREVPGVPPAELEALIRRQKADLVVVTSMDSTHDEYVIRALRAGCDVICEKPLTTTAEKLTAIMAAIRETGRLVRVTFNMRYAPVRMQVKRLLQEGVIGRVRSVEFRWLLNIRHGADYFRRWHRNKANSGGLLVHKATHHFDAVNWWIQDVPVRVSATGARLFYTPEQAERYGLRRRSERCRGCPEACRCPFFLDLEHIPALKTMYLDQEGYDGYFRDRCIFSSAMDIEDTVAATVEYRSGIRMSYGLTAFCPTEGYEIAFNGTKGRLEHGARESSSVFGGGETPGEVNGLTIRIWPHFGKPYAVTPEESLGSHGGGDDRLMKDLFSANPGPDPLGLRADWRAGAWSILTGIAANRAIRENRVVAIEDLVPDLPLPDYPPAPAWEAPIPLPADLSPTAPA
jgi:predicted dehydrogenase